LAANTNLELRLVLKFRLRSAKLTYRLFLDVVESVGRRINDLAFDFVCPSTVVSQDAGAGCDVTLGHGNGLAIVERLNGSEDLGIALEEVCELVKSLSPVARCLLSPFALKSFACGGNGDVDVLLCGLVDRGDYGLVGGVDDLEGLALYALNELIVDEAGDMVSNPSPRHLGARSSSNVQSGWLLVLAREGCLKRYRSHCVSWMRV
jgi:hypothetical protein